MPRSRLRVALITLSVITVAAILAALFVHQPRSATSEVKGLEERFLEAYAHDVGFREAVESLRRMVLDPEAEFDRGRAFELFNLILSRLGLPSMPPEYFSWGKSVSSGAGAPPPPVTCGPPPPLVLRIVQPAVDVEAGNGVEGVYACAFSADGATAVEVTVVFGDEDRGLPGSTEDLWYDAWRLVSWGRIKDVETFYVVLSEQGGYVKFQGLALVLNGTLGLRSVAPIGSGGAGFSTSAHLEGLEAFSGPELTLYVNTWNHALSTVDANPGLAKRVYTYSLSGVGVASRVDVENTLSTLRYAGEVRLRP
ncbi:hypothetical protein [Infirmifilum sp. NZ]|uniref:hypothetical protein n=1 Tax=Infirmifilum sp. NZ TaxID=2926850 RepID=UPI0027A017F9|nr:hypothetical protein [Infirmifilum sp. NZ]UNQ73798.1 hypothetical protein MOV14_01995 [Infirmifilum sp. NZ]